jgi:regulator of CtrA degradation
MQDNTRGTDTVVSNMAISGTHSLGPAAVSFTERMLASENFMVLFREGMSLVEATAAYLDGEGRAESRALDRTVALAYASESMRLTTRLMQLTSWLLLQRAVNEGELSRDDAEREHRRVVVAMQETTVAPDIFEQLPEALRDLISRSLSLHARIQRIDRELKGEVEPEAPVNPVSQQLGQLAAAFSRK